MEGAPGKKTYHLPEVGNKDALEKFRKGVFNELDRLKEDERETLTELLKKDDLHTKTELIETDIPTIKEIVRLFDSKVTFDDESDKTSDTNDTNAALTAPTRAASTRVTVTRGRGLKVVAKTTTKVTAKKTTPSLDGAEKVTFDESETTVGELREKISVIETELQDWIEQQGFTSKELIASDSAQYSESYVKLKKEFATLKAQLTNNEKGKNVKLETLQNITQRLQPALVAFRDDMAPRIKVKEERYEDITKPVGKQEIAPGVRGVAIINGEKRPARFVERLGEDKLEVSLLDVDEADNDIVVKAGEFQIFASQERVQLKQEWKKLKEDRAAAEKNFNWWKPNKWGSRSKAAKAEEAAHQKYVQSLLPELQKRETRNQEDGQIVANMQRRVPELQAKLAELQSAGESAENQSAITTLENRITRVNRYLENPTDIYRVWAVNKFIVRKKQEADAMREGWLNEKQKANLVSIKEHLSRNKWRYRGLGLGVATILTGGGAALAGGGLMTVLAGASGGAGLWGMRFAAGAVAGSAAGGLTYAEETRKVKKLEQRASEVEIATAQASFDNLIHDFEDINQDYITATDDLRGAYRRRTRNTLLVGGSAGFAAGGAVSFIDSLIDQVAEMPGVLPELKDNQPLGNPFNENAVGKSLRPEMRPEVEQPSVSDTVPARADQEYEPTPTPNYPPQEASGIKAEMHSPGIELQDVPNQESTETPDITVSTIEPTVNPEVMQSSALDIEVTPEDTLEVQTEIPNPKQMFEVPEGKSVSEALYQAYCDSELKGLPEGMGRIEFLNKMYAAIHAVDNNEAIMQHMQMDSGDLDKIRAGDSFNATPIIEHMNGRSIAEIEHGMYEADQLLGRGEDGTTPRTTTPVESPRPEMRPDTTQTSFDATTNAPSESVAPTVRPETETTAFDATDKAPNESKVPTERPENLAIPNDEAVAESPRPVERSAAEAIARAVETKSVTTEMLVQQPEILSTYDSTLVNQGVSAFYKALHLKELTAWSNEMGVSDPTALAEQLNYYLQRDLALAYIARGEVVPVGDGTGFNAFVGEYDQNFTDTLAKKVSDLSDAPVKERIAALSGSSDTDQSIENAIKLILEKNEMRYDPDTSSFNLVAKP